MTYFYGFASLLLEVNTRILKSFYIFLDIFRNSKPTLREPFFGLQLIFTVFFFQC